MARPERVTTEELRDIYGYNHPPRAARDVREAGIPLRTVRVLGTDGRSIGAYEFGDPEEIEEHKLRGRRTFSKEFKQTLIEASDGRCEVCGTRYEERYLQIDHRVPYEVAGDEVAGEDSPAEFQLLCASCQRSKSWTCEHCENWQAMKKRKVCESCYWGCPADYDHVAGRPERRLSLAFSGADEVRDYERLQRVAEQRKMGLGALVKALLRQVLRRLLK